jgi:hypothetical protein
MNSQSYWVQQLFARMPFALRVQRICGSWSSARSSVKQLVLTVEQLWLAQRIKAAPAAV